MTTLYVILIVLAIIYPIGAFFASLSLTFPDYREPRYSGKQRLLRLIFWPRYFVEDVYNHYRKDWHG